MLITSFYNHTCSWSIAGEGCVGVSAITFQELREKVAVYASALRRLGVTVGDRVVGKLPSSQYYLSCQMWSPVAVCCAYGKCR